jgi:hypothetical protein
LDFGLIIPICFLSELLISFKYISFPQAV